jgi:hypothetical protein
VEEAYDNQPDNGADLIAPRDCSRRSYRNLDSRLRPNIAGSFTDSAAGNAIAVAKINPIAREKILREHTARPTRNLDLSIRSAKE